MFKYIFSIAILYFSFSAYGMEQDRKKIDLPRLSYLDLYQNIKLAAFYDENYKAINACKIDDEHEKKSKRKQLSSNIEVFKNAYLHKPTTVTFSDIDNICPACWESLASDNKNGIDLEVVELKSCKFKFHTSCLFQWISVSHRTTCPLLCGHN